MCAKACAVACVDVPTEPSYQKAASVRHVGKAIAPLLCCKKTKKKKKEPHSHQNQNFSWRWKGLKGRGVGSRVEGAMHGNGRQDHGRVVEGWRGNWWWGEQNCTHTETQTHTIPKHQPHRRLQCSSKADNPTPSLRRFSEPPKLVPMDLCISVLQQWTNYNQAPSPN